MDIHSLFQTLADHADKTLQVQFGSGRQLPEGYHLTEVKNVAIDSIDCGANTHQEKQVHIQLWTNPESSETGFMTAGKALKILQKVDQIRPTFTSVPVYLEYGDSQHLTSNYRIEGFEVKGETLWLKTFVEPTVCKPAEAMNISCGVSSKLKSCCES